MLAEINTSELAVQRSEVACIWHGERNGQIIDFRSDTAPQAVLGVELETRPSGVALPTSHGMAIDVLRPQ
jgi:hypothetical protein